jgi:hypothetical protein
VPWDRERASWGFCEALSHPFYERSQEFALGLGAGVQQTSDLRPIGLRPPALQGHVPPRTTCIDVGLQAVRVMPVAIPEVVDLDGAPTRAEAAPLPLLLPSCHSVVRAKRISPENPVRLPGAV